MEERAHAIGGEIHIVTRPRDGVTIRVRVPAGLGATAEKSVAPGHSAVTDFRNSA
jgi:signal transduction histidine kinase